MSRYKKISELLLSLRSTIGGILFAPEDELHRLRLEQLLQKESDYILLVTGTDDVTTYQSETLPPATTIGGVPIAKLRKFTEEDLTPSDDKVFNLKQRIEAIYPTFVETDSAKILATIDDILIRGVAKKAKVKVTKDTPAKIDLEFIEKIKAEIIKLENPEKGKQPTPDIELETKESVTDAGTSGGISDEFILDKDNIGAPLGEGEVITETITNEVISEPADKQVLTETGNKKEENETKAPKSENKGTKPKSQGKADK